VPGWQEVLHWGLEANPPCGCCLVCAQGYFVRVGRRKVNPEIDRERRPVVRREGGAQPPRCNGYGQRTIATGKRTKVLAIFFAGPVYAPLLLCIQLAVMGQN